MIDKEKIDKIITAKKDQFNVKNIPNYKALLSSWSALFLKKLKKHLVNFINTNSQYINSEIWKMEEVIKQKEDEIQEFLKERKVYQDEIDKAKEDWNNKQIKYFDITGKDGNYVKNLISRKKKVLRDLKNIYDIDAEHPDNIERENNRNTLIKEQEEIENKLKEEQDAYRERELAGDEYRFIYRKNQKKIKGIDFYVKGYENYQLSKAGVDKGVSLGQMGELVLELKSFEQAKSTNKYVLKQDIIDFKSKVLPKIDSSESVSAIADYMWRKLYYYTNGAQIHSELTTFDIESIIETFENMVEGKIDRILKNTNLYEYIYYKDSMSKKEIIDGKEYIRFESARYGEDGFIKAVINHLLRDQPNFRGPLIGILINSINSYIKSIRNQKVSLDAPSGTDSEGNERKLIDIIPDDHDPGGFGEKKDDDDDVIETNMELAKLMGANFSERSGEIASTAMGYIRNKFSTFDDETEEEIESKIEQAIIDLEPHLPNIFAFGLSSTSSFDNKLLNTINDLLGYRGYVTGTIEHGIRKIVVGVVKIEILAYVLDLFEKSGYAEEIKTNKVLKQYKNRLNIEKEKLIESKVRKRITKFIKPDEMASRLINETKKNDKGEDEEKESSWLLEHKADFITQNGGGSAGFVDTGKHNERVVKK